MQQIRPAAERGHSQLSWLNSYHSFSFGDYYDPRFQGFSHLRVINDDRVMPGAGFATHGHRDMEIISYVRQGTLAHQRAFATQEGLQLIASPDGADGSLQVAQGMTLYRWQSGPLDYVLAPGRWLYLQLLTGQLNGPGIYLTPGDGLQVREPGTLNLQGQGEVLLFDLPAV